MASVNDKSIKGSVRYFRRIGMMMPPDRVHSKVTAARMTFGSIEGIRRRVSRRTMRRILSYYRNAF